MPHENATQNLRIKFVKAVKNHVTATRITEAGATLAPFSLRYRKATDTSENKTVWRCDQSVTLRFVASSGRITGEEQVKATLS